MSKCDAEDASDIVRLSPLWMKLGKSICGGWDTMRDKGVCCVAAFKIFFMFINSFVQIPTSFTCA